MKLIKKKFLQHYWLFALALLLAACGTAEGKSKEIKIGYQKNATTLSLKSNEDFLK